MNNLKLAREGENFVYGMNSDELEFTDHNKCFSSIYQIFKVVLENFKGFNCILQ